MNTSLLNLNIQHWKKEGSWKDLEHIAFKLVQQVETENHQKMNAVLGGGTRLMLDLEHRISHDIDLFISNPQWLGYLSPRLNDNISDIIDGYEEGSEFLKLRFQNGEIDFIVRTPLLKNSPISHLDTVFKVEPIMEVLAKKLFFRGHALTSRDLFDWWAISESKLNFYQPEFLMGILTPLKIIEIEKVLSIIEANQSKFFNERWTQIQAPYKPDLQEVARWAKAETQKWKLEKNLVIQPKF